VTRYTVKYQAGTYAGTCVVYADDADAALDKVRAEVRRSMSLPMYADSYRVVEERAATEDDE
jgi:hypothetical protein